MVVKGFPLIKFQSEERIESLQNRVDLYEFIRMVLKS